METFIAQIMAGIATGSIYACFGLAVVMTYQSTQMLNFAQGEMALLSTFVAWSLLNWGVPYVFVFVITLVFAFLLGVGVERSLLRPLRGRPALSTVIVLIGLLTIINSLVGWVYGHATKTFPSPFPNGSPLESGMLSYHQLGVLAVTLGVVALLFGFLRFTRVGLAMRSASLNPDSSRLSGIPVNRMLALGWGVASALGAIAGMMLAPMLFLDPSMMLGVLLYGFAAAIVGGLDSPWGAVPGGILLGVLENVFGVYVVGTELKLSVALLAIFIVLLFRPSGMFGRVAAGRV